jgi:hypothetical protein
MKAGLCIAALYAGLAFAPTMACAQSVSLHGFADVSFKNDYVTPRGLVVTAQGSTIQALDGLVLDFPQSGNTITDASLVVGAWGDFNPGYSKLHNSESFNEFDWFVGGNIKVGKNLKLGAQYVEFISPQGAYKTEHNLEFSAAYDDSSYFKGFSFQPYVKLFYAMSGGSTVAVGQAGNTFDVEIGAVPNLAIKGTPVTLSAPTWVTVGPESFWGAGGGNAGVFSTGLKASVALPTPPSAGHWSVYAGYQYYHLINDRLVLAEYLLNAKADRDVSLFQVGLGLGF